MGSPQIFTCIFCCTLISTNVFWLVKLFFGGGGVASSTPPVSFIHMKDDRIITKIALYKSYCKIQLCTNPKFNAFKLCHWVDDYLDSANYISIKKQITYMQVVLEFSSVQVKFTCTDSFIIKFLSWKSLPCLFWPLCDLITLCKFLSSFGLLRCEKYRLQLSVWLCIYGCYLFIALCHMFQWRKMGWYMLYYTCNPGIMYQVSIICIHCINEQNWPEIL